MSNLREAMQQALEALELHGEQYPHMVKGYCLDAITALRAALAEPEQEPWSTRERFYAHLDQAVENIRQRMTIRTVTMRCKDFDYVLPIIDAMEGHVLVGPAPTPRKPLSDAEIACILDRGDVAERNGMGGWHVLPYALTRAIEAAHGIKEQEHE